MIALRTILNRFLFKKILFLGKGKHLIERKRVSLGAWEDKPERAGSVILAKRYYFETSATFPFSKTKEMRAAITMDMSSYAPFQTEYFFLMKVSEKDDGATVNMWFIDPALDSTLKTLSPRLIIPESALFSYFEEEKKQIYAIHNEEASLLVFKGSDGLTKSLMTQDADHTLEEFKRTIGAPANDCEVTPIRGMEAYLPLLGRTLHKMPFQRMLPFINRDPGSIAASRRHLKWGLGTAAGMLLLFFGISFMLPYVALSRLEAEDRTLSTNLREVLKKQDDLLYHYEKQGMFVDKINQYPRKIEVLGLLKDLLPPGTRIQQFNASGNMIEIRGVTPKGSELLSRLATGKGIKNARFMSGIKRNKKTGLEMFSVSFGYGG